MPTQVEVPKRSPSSQYEPFSWTDDLPPCRLTGAGYSTNQKYREDGHRIENHSFEDCSLHRSRGDVSIYGVFDGYDGNQIAIFALQQLAAELFFGNLLVDTKDEEVKEDLRQAFLSVEKYYLKSIDAKVAERTSLLYKQSEGWTPYEIERLRYLNGELSCGTTAVLALVIGDRLFVANVGNSRALLCRTDDHGVLRVTQLSVDHDTTNEDEMLRLLNLGLDLKKGTLLGNQENTRCLGNYLVKGGYKEYFDLSKATEEPVIPEPEIIGPIHLDESSRFLLLMSDGLYRSLEEANGIEQVNKEIAQMVDKEFRVQSTLMGVAQAVVDRVVRLHHDAFMSGGGVITRDDITLLVRNFNHPLPHGTPLRGGFWSRGDSSTIRSDEDSSIGTDRGGFPTSSTRSKSYIPAYVDFTEFRRNIQAAKENGTLPPELDF